jgi:hypothetical protein
MAKLAQAFWQLAQSLNARQPLGQARRPGNGVCRLAGKNVINIQVDHVSLDSTGVKVYPDGTGALKKTVYNLLANRAAVGQPKSL